MRGGPRGFRPGFPCPAVLRYLSNEVVPFRVRDCYPLRCDFPFASATTRLCNSSTRRQADQDRPYNTRTTTTAVYHIARVWAHPFSLATTQGIEVSFFSSGYLDVSVPQLASSCPMYSGMGTRALPRVSFLIRKSWDQRSVSTSPRLIAAAHVLHRLLAPRHPPCALVLLIRKEHVLDVAMEFSRCAQARVPAVQKARRLHTPGGERRRTVSQNSTACGCVPPVTNHQTTHTMSTRVDVIPGEPYHRTSSSRSSTHQRV